MGPSLTDQLKSLTLGSIGDGLAAVATGWVRLCVDHLPSESRTLAELQEQYAELLEALPPCSAAEIEPLLQQYARALHLRGDRISATQRQYLQGQFALHGPGHDARIYFKVEPRDSLDDSLRSICHSAGREDAAVSAGATFYVASHHSLGRGASLLDAAPTQPSERPGQPPLVDASGVILLGPLLSAHAASLAATAAQRQSDVVALAPEDQPDFATYDEEAGAESWLEAVLEDDATFEDEDDAPPLAHAHRLGRRHG